jgi:hypothetical protein
MSASLFRPRRHRADDGEHWLTVSDLMSGLMIIFLFVAVTYLQPLASKATELEEKAEQLQEANTGLAAARERVREIVIAFNEDEAKLASELEREKERLAAEGVRSKRRPTAHGGSRRAASPYTQTGHGVFPDRPDEERGWPTEVTCWGVAGITCGAPR